VLNIVYHCLAFQERKVKVFLNFSFNFAKQMSMTKIMIGFRVTPEFKQFMENLADSENRTLSSFIENALLTYIAEHKKIDWKARQKDGTPPPK
jgi:predicted DNA-binding protein